MKTTYKKVINILLVLFLGVLFFPVTAQASCSVNGPVVRVWAYDDSYTSTGCYIYMRSGGPLSSVYYYARSNDDNTCTNAAIAATSGVDTQMAGSSTACPTSGTGRYMGVVQYLAINP
jgi:expansin (peptidoglycan-binding protein)